MTPPDLFSAAGIPLEAAPPSPKPKRRRKPTPAERAAAARALGARRPVCPCVDGHRIRIGGPRDLHPAKIAAFPLSRNVALLQDTLKQLPHLYADEWDKQRMRVARNLEQKLLRRGIPKDEAQACAMELLHVAFRIRANEAHKEMGIK